MSKKSAKSKGYRSFKKEKPFLTKKEIYALIVIAAVVIIGFIVFLCYDDGALKIKDGALEGVESNWIVTNTGTTTSPRYFKLAEAGEVEGYSMQPYLSYADYNLRDVYYYPTDENNPVDYISISTTGIKNSSVAELGKTVTDALKTMPEYTVTAELTEATAGDIPYSYYSFTTEAYVAPAEEDVVTTEAVDSATADAAAAEDAASEAVENEPNTFGQSLNAYVETAHDSCLLIHVINETESTEEFLPDADLQAVLEQIINAITLEEK